MLNLRIELIRTDGGTQARATLHPDAVTEYAEAIGRRERLPPPVVFHDGESYWLADGFHRIAAYAKAGAKDVLCEVKNGTCRDAVLYAVGANAAHGLRRSNADKRRAVELLLHDVEWSTWSDREIARRACVTHPFVTKVRSEVGAASGNGYQIQEPDDALGETAASTGESTSTDTRRRKAIRRGRAYAVRTRNINKAKPRVRKPREASEPTVDLAALEHAHAQPLSLVEEMEWIRRVLYAVRSARFSWQALVVDWNARQRDDLQYAMSKDERLNTLFAELHSELEDIVARLAGDSSPVKSPDATTRSRKSKKVTPNE